MNVRRQLGEPAMTKAWHNRRRFSTGVLSCLLIVVLCDIAPSQERDFNAYPENVTQYPTADPTNRLNDIRAMIESMAPDLEAGRSMLLIGDLNHGPDTDEDKPWIDAGCLDTSAQVGKGDGPTIKSEIPKWRIDYVMAAGPIADQVVESRPLFEGAFRLHINDKESFTLSNHLPQLAVFDAEKQ